MASSPDHGQTVTFTTKELILQIDAKLDTLTTLVSGKADQAQVAALQSRVSNLETQMEHRSKASHNQANQLVVQESRIVKLETGVAREDAVKEYRKWIVAGGGITGILAMLTIIGLIRDLLGG